MFVTQLQNKMKNKQKSQATSREFPKEKSYRELNSFLFPYLAPPSQFPFWSPFFYFLLQILNEFLPKC